MSEAKAEPKPTKEQSLKAIFEWIDSDKDGSLVLSEMKKFADALNKQDAARLFAMADLNNDSKVSKDEFQKFVEGLINSTFAKIDANKNGKIDKSEISSMVLMMIEGVDFSKLSSGYIEGLREEAEKELGTKEANFEQFETWVLELLSGSLLKCKGSVEVPKHLTNLLAFNLDGKDWSKLLGSKTLAAHEEKKKADAEMEAKIKAAMDLAFAAENAAKDAEQKKAAEEQKKKEAEAKKQNDERQRLEAERRRREMTDMEERIRGAGRMRMVAKKPVVYVYSPEEQDVKVTLEFKNSDSWDNLVSYPKLSPATIQQNSGKASRHTWTVRTGSQGALYEQGKGRALPYLFYEAGTAGIELKPEECFCVGKDDVERFLQSSLTTLGLNKKEIQDFQMFWLPSLQATDYSLIRFCAEEFSEQVSLTTSPAAATSLRVYMVWAGSSKKIETRPAPLTAFKSQRKGLVLCEWGGQEVTFE